MMTVKNLYSNLLTGPVLFTVMGYAYCPKPATYFDSGNVATYAHSTFCPTKEIVVAPFNVFSLASECLFTMWIELGLPSPTKFGTVWFSPYRLQHLHKLFCEHGIARSDFDTLVVMDRMTREQGKD